MDYNRRSERIEHLNPEGAEPRVLMDLSATGACCLHGKEKARGALVLLRIDDEEIPAKVMYCQQREGLFRLGVQFWNPSADQKRAIAEVVDRYSKGVPVDCEVAEEDDEDEGED